MTRYPGAAGLALRRAAAALPAPVRAALGRWRGAPRADAGVVDGWDAPLLGAAAEALTLPAPLPAGDAPSEVERAHVVRPLRCLLVSDTLDASGVEEFVAFLARGLRAAGWTVAILVLADGVGRLGRDLQAEGVEVRALGAEEGSRWMTSWAPDVLDSHSDAIWPLAAAAQRGIPSVLTLHGVHNVMGRSAREVAAHRASAHTVVAVSELVRDQYRAADLSFPAERVVAIGNSVDPARVPRYHRADVRAALGLSDEFLFLSLARHGVQKNAYGLVAAFAEVARAAPKAHLLIAGRVDDPAYAAQVVALRDRAGLRGRVHLRGHLDGAPALLWAADAFVLDSFFEGWSLASLEAIGTGLPCILADVGGAREQLAGGPSRGILVPAPIPPDLLSWERISRARFLPQDNRQELVQALRDVAAGNVGFAPREIVADDAVRRFSADACLGEHAKVLSAAAAARTVREGDRW
ncbi:glycosyltransferase [Microbacterium sp. dk485]|uniref:glycosyltransferase n=1 Tax=Microbacterium sp. dk485 TaxID=2560021 RepID=UPI00107386E3|nr:glycosyltransferase [Microbacterium sp. dk485]TFV84078.1 glycosyltransferase [Microbacterium sp. dk485]